MCSKTHSPKPVTLTSLEETIRPLLFSGVVGSSYTRLVSGLQYHLCGEMDTRTLAVLAGISADDVVLDECCFIGGPALQLAMEFRCKVVGVDRMASAIEIANRLADDAGLSGQLAFRLGDARQLPFADGQFSVVWNQCSLEHDVHWIDELDRVLQPGGRIALTLQIVTGERNPADPFGRWRLADLAAILMARGYEIIDCSDITERDALLGWGTLIEKTERNRDLYAASFGEDWVENARQAFEKEAEAMRQRKVGNGRIVAKKPGLVGGSDAHQHAERV